MLDVPAHTFISLPDSLCMILKMQRRINLHIRMLLENINCIFPQELIFVKCFQFFKILLIAFFYGDFRNVITVYVNFGFNSLLFNRAFY